MSQSPPMWFIYCSHNVVNEVNVWGRANMDAVAAMWHFDRITDPFIFYGQMMPTNFKFFFMVEIVKSLTKANAMGGSNDNKTCLL